MLRRSTFFVRNIMLSTISGSILALSAVTISPAVLKTRSDGTLVAWIDKFFIANLYRIDSRDYFNLSLEAKKIHMSREEPECV